MADVLVLSDSLSNPVKAVCHDTGDGGQVPGWAETSRGKVAAVLHGLVAPGRGHILRHCGGWSMDLITRKVLRATEETRDAIWAGGIGTECTAILRLGGEVEEALWSVWRVM